MRPALYFDLDNTLIDRNAAMSDCLQSFFEQYLPQLDYAVYQTKLLAQDNWGYTSRTIFCQWFIDFFHQKNLLLNWTADSFWLFLKENISRFVPPATADLIKVLQQLQAHYQLGIVTNGSVANQSAKIRQAGFDKIFSSARIHISEAYGYAKPNPVLWQTILEKDNLTTSQLTYIGDDPIKDIEHVRPLGITTIWVSHYRPWQGNSEPTFVFSRLEASLLKKHFL